MPGLNPEIPQSGEPRFTVEAPARTPTLFLETCVGQKDIVQPDLDALSPRQQQCSVVFRSAKQDTNDSCLTGHTDAE
jgi:hypothetical protein